MPMAHRKDHSTWPVTAALSLIVLVALVAVAGCSGAPVGNESTTPTVTVGGRLIPTSNGMPQVRGAEIVDGTGHTLLLRGAMIPTSFAYINSWQHGQDPTTILDATTFTTMANWRMNAVRINISYWIYQLNPGQYLARLDQAVAAAHAAKLYVILDYHDDAQSGNPAPDGLMHAETVTFWKILATHYKTDPMMLFDPMNEPKYGNWQTWLHGDGTGVVGYQQVIDAIRSVGAPQIIVLEPGHACPTCNHTAWVGVDQYLPRDPNIIFSLHEYAGVVVGNPQVWDAAWGPVLGRYPIYYGEWAVLPHADHPVFCRGLSSSNADTITNAFLSYAQSRQANWTAWDFSSTNMIQSFTDYAPTTFQSGAPWSCESASASQAGMGADVKQFLSTH